MSTYRERREARAERLRDWAGRREARAAAVFKSHEVYRGDTAFNTQPGYIPERARVNRAEEREFHSLQKASRMSERAGNIESQLERAIYSDDPDAIPALEARLAALEAKRERIKADNAAFRAAVKAAGLTKAQMPYSWQGGKFQGHTLHADFELKNLGGDITRNRSRLEELRKRAGRAAPPPPPLASISGMVARARAQSEPGQMGLFRVSGAELERERRRRSRQAKQQRRRRDGRFH